MFNVNRVTLLGTVTQDPEVHTSKKGTVTRIGFATNCRSKDADGNPNYEVEAHRLVCFGPLAEFAAKDVQKATPLYVEGKIQTSRNLIKGKWEWVTEIVLDRLVVLSSKKSNGERSLKQ